MAPSVGFGSLLSWDPEWLAQRVSLRYERAYEHSTGNNRSAQHFGKSAPQS